jgi:hypothetical protein
MTRHVFAAYVMSDLWHTFSDVNVTTYLCMPVDSSRQPACGTDTCAAAALVPASEIYVVLNQAAFRRRVGRPPV